MTSSVDDAGTLARPRTLGVGAAIAVLVLTVALVMPFSRIQAGSDPSFAVAVIAIVGCFDLMSALLLIQQFRDTGDRRSLALSWAYVFALILLGGYSAAFPGVISTHPPLGSNPSTAPWLWVAWHTGFPILLGAALAPWPRRWDAEVALARRRRLVWQTVGGSFAIGVAVVVAIVLGIGSLPSVIDGLSLAPLTHRVGPYMLPVVVIATAVAIAGARRPGPARWAAVAATAATGDTVLTLFSQLRYSIGWYAGRSLTVVSSAAVLVALLAEFGAVKHRLAEEGELLRAQLARTDELERVQTTLLHHMVDGVFMQDRDGKFVAINQAALDILGINEDERGGGAALENFRARLLQPDGSPWKNTTLTPPQKTMRTGEPQRDEIVGVTTPAAEPTWMSVRTAAATAPDGSVEAVITCLTDITRAHSAQLAAATAAAQRRHRIIDILERQAITMVFQPIVALDTGRIVGAEALARFPGHPNPTPDVWFAEAATEDLGIDLELAAVGAALGRLNDLPAGSYLSINVSPSAALSPQLQRLLSGAPAHRIVVELTEHASVDDYEEVIAALHVLRTSGVRLAVDDAGAGFASLRHILNLRPDLIKLDLALTRGIDRDPARRALAASLLAFGAEIGASIVAEGIETPGELSSLRTLGVRYGQGYHLGLPAALPLVLTTDYIDCLAS